MPRIGEARGSITLNLNDLTTAMGEALQEELRLPWPDTLRNQLAQQRCECGARLLLDRRATTDGPVLILRHGYVQQRLVVEDFNNAPLIRDPAQRNRAIIESFTHWLADLHDGLSLGLSLQALSSDFATDFVNEPRSEYETLVALAFYLDTLGEFIGQLRDAYTLLFDMREPQTHPFWHSEARTELARSLNLLRRQARQCTYCVAALVPRFRDWGEQRMYDTAPNAVLETTSLVERAGLAVWDRALLTSQMCVILLAALNAERPPTRRVLDTFRPSRPYMEHVFSRARAYFLTTNELRVLLYRQARAWVTQRSFGGVRYEHSDHVNPYRGSRPLFDSLADNIASDRYHAECARRWDALDTLLVDDRLRAELLGELLSQFPVNQHRPRLDESLAAAFDRLDAAGGGAAAAG